MDIVREIQAAIKTGKVLFGHRQTLKSIVNNQVKMIIISSNVPEQIRRDITKLCKLSGVPIYEFPGTSWDLGAVCNKPFMVTTLAVLDPGASGIIELAKGAQ